MKIIHDILILYLSLVNLFAFCLYGVDKHKAVRGKWRIRERTLLLAAAVGGSAGSLFAMIFFRHKTRKPKFYVTVPLLLVIHVLLFGALFLRLRAQLL